MRELFKHIFAKHQLSDDQFNELIGRFGSVLMMSIVANAKDLEDDSIAKIHQLWDQSRFQEILDIVRSKYSHKEWQEYAYQQTAPLLEDYLHSLLKNKSV